MRMLMRDPESSGGGNAGVSSSLSSGRRARLTAGRALAAVLVVMAASAGVGALALRATTGLAPSAVMPTVLAPEGEEIPPGELHPGGREVPEQEKETEGDPVRVESGQLVIDERDLFIEGRGLDFDLRRHYRSSAGQYTTLLGPKWCHSYDQKLVLSVVPVEQLPPGYGGPGPWLNWTEGELPDTEHLWEMYTDGMILSAYGYDTQGQTTPWWLTTSALKLDAYVHDGATGMVQFFPQHPSLGNEGWLPEVGIYDKLLGIPDESIAFYPGWVPPKAFILRQPDGLTKWYSLSWLGCAAEPWFVYGPRACDSTYVPQNGGAWSPDRYATHRTFDYQEQVLSPPGLEILNITSPWKIDLVQDSMTQVLGGWAISLQGMAQRGNLGEVNGDGSHIVGNVIKDSRQTSTFTDIRNPSSQFSIQSLVKLYSYNVYGLQKSYIDEEQKQFTVSYHPANDPDGDGTPTPPPTYPGGGAINLSSTSGAEGGGYLWKRSAPSSLGITHTYKYNAFGSVIEYQDPRYEFHQERYLVEVNAYGERVVVTDPRGYETRYFYDHNGNVIQEERTNARPTFTSTGLPTGAETIDEWIQVFKAYDINDNVITIRRPLPSQSPGAEIIERRRYDKESNLVLVLNPNWTSGSGHLSCSVLNERDRVWSHSIGGISTEFANSFAHDDFVGTLQLPVNPSGISTERSVWRYSTLATFTDAGGRVTTVLHDGFNRPTQVLRPLGTNSYNTFDPEGSVVEASTIGENGHGGTAVLDHRRVRFDEANRAFQIDLASSSIDSALTTIEGALSPGDGFASTRFKYDRRGLLTYLVDDNIRGLQHFYDDIGRPTSTLDDLGNHRDNTYDKNGNVIQIRDHEFNNGGVEKVTTTRSFYDELDRLHAQANNVGETLRFLYDSRGNKTFTSDAISPLVDPLSSLDLFGEHANLPGLTINGHGATSIVEYDEASRPVRTTHEKGNAWDPNTITLDKSFDLNGNLVAETDGKLNSTSYAYDARNWLVSTTFADGTNESIDEYSPTGMPQRTTDPNGTVAVLTWDDLDRMTYRSLTLAAGVGGGTYERYRYDGLARLTEAEDDDSLVVRHYNAQGRVLSENLNGEVTTTIPDGVGNTRTIGYPSGRQVTVTPDALNRPGAIADQQGAIAAFLYEGFARIDKRIARPGSGQELAWDLGYNAANRVTSSLHSLQGNPQAIDQRTYQWDRMGNRTQRVDQLSGLSHTLSYDSVYRLRMSTVSGPISGSTTYSLDDAGNRGVVTGLWAAGNYTLAGGDAPVNQYSTVPGEAWTYDNNGNLIAKAPSSGGPAHAALIYDARNRLVEYQDIARGKVHRYKYDALGRRIRKIVDATGAASTTRFFYAGDRVVEEKDASGALLATYVHGYYIDELIEVERDFDANGTMDKAYFVSDDSHSVAKPVSAAGAVLESYAYDDFGRPLNTTSYQTLGTSAHKNRYFFTGREYDFESGLYWYRTRYYDPMVGRFTSRDSIGMWGDPVEMGNGQSYVGNNPWSYGDPYGMGLQAFAKGFGEGVLGGAADLGGGLWSAAKGSLMESFGLAKDLLGAAFGEGTIGGVLEERLGQVLDWVQGMKELLDEEGWDGTLALAFPGTAKAAKLLKKLRDGKEVDDEELGEAIGRASVEMGATAAGGFGVVKGVAAGAKAAGQLAGNIRTLARGGRAGAMGARSVVDVLKGLKAGTGSNSRVRLVDSADELESLFGRLSTGGTPVEGTTYRGRLVELPDGTRVGIRQVSDSGGPAIDIHPPSGPGWKVHAGGGS